MLFHSNKQLKNSNGAHAASNLSFKISSISAQDILNQNLHEIIDKNVIAQLVNLSPQFLSSLEKTSSLSDGEKIYRVKLPVGKSLVKAKINGKKSKTFFRGFSRDKSGTNQALLEEVQPKNALLTTANVMNAASMVVGQYYMTEISAKMEDLNASINEVKEFQQRKFKSELKSLLINLKDCSKFSLNILNDEETRTVRRNVLMDYRKDATRLLEQVNGEIQDLTEKPDQKAVADYFNKTSLLKKLLFSQQALLTTLMEIGRLQLLFSQNNDIQQGYFDIYQTYFKKSQQLLSNLKLWHTKKLGKYEIDLANHRLAKQGIEKTVFDLVGMLNDDWRYDNLSPKTATEISKQLHYQLLAPQDLQLDYFDQDAELLLKNGKVYYQLPEK